MEQYLDLVKTVLSHEQSYYKPNRTASATISHFGAQKKYDLSKGFPLLTTKKVLYRAVFGELLWFLKGSTNIAELKEQGIPIWDSWADENGELGPIYGSQWRNWGGQGIDQISNAIYQIRNNPDSRRIIVSAWNVADIDKMAIPPCHAFFQFNVREGNLDLQLYQRSADIALGVPFNIASYAGLDHLIANTTGLKPGIFTHTLGDMHIYCGEEKRGEWYGRNLGELKERMCAVKKPEDNLKVLEWIERNAPPEPPGEKINRPSDHVPGLLIQLTRAPGKLPKLEIADKRLDELKKGDIRVVGYEPQEFIKFGVAV